MYELPIFPLTMFPIPGEVVAMHIFEPRYRQLLQDIEQSGQGFGIYFAHGMNQEKLGSEVVLEKITKKYPGGESDILVRCTGNFVLNKFYKKMPGKLYPGGKAVKLKKVPSQLLPTDLKYEFEVYSQLKNIDEDPSMMKTNEMAMYLNLEMEDKMKFIRILDPNVQVQFLSNRIRYQAFILEQEQKSKDTFQFN